MGVCSGAGGGGDGGGDSGGGCGDCGGSCGGRGFFRGRPRFRFGGGGSRSPGSAVVITLNEGMMTRDEDG
jgi:hypothetical protein